MLTNVLARLFPSDGQPLVYTSTLNGTRFATQWTVYRGRSGTGPAGAGLHDIEFYMELDLSAIEQGPTVIQQRARLLCDDAFTPLRYHSHAAGASVGIRFDGQQAHVDMPDGSSVTVPTGDARFVIESNIVGEQALMLALAHDGALLDGEARFTCFVVNGLLPTPYATTPAPDLQAARGGEGIWLRSSHEEELFLDRDGVLVEAHTPSQGIVTRRERPAPALPTWHAEATLTIDQPRYAPPAGANFSIEDVVIPGPVTPLGGTLTIPPGDGPFPAVLFLSGSGSHDRHGVSGEIDIGTHEILDHLAGEGFVGLRYDTRGAGGTRIGADVLEQGLSTIIADARAAIRFFSARPEVDSRRLFLVGHSQGGSVALAINAEAPALAGIVLLATVGRTIDEILIDQTVQQAEHLGMSREQIEAQVARLREFVALATSDREWVAGEIPDHLFAGARNRKWIREHMQTRTTDLIREVRCPVLLCQGDKDFQVSPTRDAERLAAAAREAGVDLTYLILPGLDHLFKLVSGDESRFEQYFDRARRVDAGFLAQLTSWLRARS